MKKMISLLLAALLLFGICGLSVYADEPNNAAVSELPSDEDDVILSDDASDFVLLSEAVPDAILEIRYYSTYNFVGDRIDGYEEPLAFLTREAAAALKEVSDELVAKGYRLKIYDAYRPQMAVTNFMNWALDADDVRMKEYFYPELEKDVLFPQGYIMEHSGHSRGSTVDLTLFDMRTEKEADMGGTFDYFGELSHPDYTGITTEQFKNRMILREAMLMHGFQPLAEEWWHFTLKDEPYPNTYFTFPVNSESLSAPDPAERGSQDIIEELAVSYGAYGNDVSPVVDELLSELRDKDPKAADQWERIMALWKTVNSDLTLNYDVLPDGLEESDALCLVTLGFQLNPDGTMKDELVERLKVVLKSAEKYPGALIVCTGGGTASENPDATEAGKMADEEFEIIKSHTSQGYDALKEITIMPELAIGAQAHHERPDGRGYPNHLKGDEIPRVAQIIAVADCFDAMYSNRPYRSRMNFDKVVSIIKEVSGTQLAPDVVDAFLRLVARGEFRDPDDMGGGSMENIENICSKES